MATVKRKRPAKAKLTVDEQDPPLTAAERRDLNRRIKDADDPRRFLLASVTLPGFSLYYVLQDDAWTIDDPLEATLFKRKTAASAVAELLQPGVFVIPCKVDARGKLVLSSIKGRKVGRVVLAVKPSWRR
jgi:hypothetical protein